MRYLAIDLGAKRTGLAVGDDLMRIATPLEVINTNSPEQRQRSIANAIDKHGPDALIIGIPLNMDDSEGPAAKNARAQAQQLGEQFGLPVHLVDERLTSVEADEHMAQSGLTHKRKKNRRDALAAAAILMRYFEQQ